MKGVVGALHQRSDLDSGLLTAQATPARQADRKRNTIRRPIFSILHY